MYQQCQKRRYATPVDVLMEIGALPKRRYEDWRLGRVPYLEGVCTINLRKLSLVMREMRVYAQRNGLKSSFTVYKRWGSAKSGGQGRKPVIPLRFSKSGKADIERWYATHFLDIARVEALREDAQGVIPEAIDGETATDAGHIPKP